MVAASARSANSSPAAAAAASAVKQKNAVRRNTIRGFRRNTIRAGSPSALSGGEEDCASLVGVEDELGGNVFGGDEPEEAEHELAGDGEDVGWDVAGRARAGAEAKGEAAEEGAVPGLAGHPFDFVDGEHRESESSNESGGEWHVSSCLAHDDACDDRQHCEWRPHIPPGLIRARTERAHVNSRQKLRRTSRRSNVNWQDRKCKMQEQY